MKTQLTAFLALVTLTTFATSSIALSEECVVADDASELIDAAREVDDHLMSRLIDQIEAQFNKHGIQFESSNRDQVIRELEKLFNYFTAENDPGASKRMTYLLSLFKYARFKRVTGAQLRALIADIGNVISKENFRADFGGDAKEAQSLFDMNQIMGVTRYMELEKTNGSVDLVFHTNCQAGSPCKIALNTGSLNAATQQRMRDNGINLSHIEYRPQVRLKITTGNEVKARAADLVTLVTKKSGANVHQTSPVAPPYVEDRFTRPELDESGRPNGLKVIRLEERVAAYANDVKNSRVDFMPILIEMDGFAIKAQWDKRQAGAAGGLLNSWRTIRVDAFAIFPQFLGRGTSYSPVLFEAHDRAFGFYDFSIKIAR